MRFALQVTRTLLELNVTAGGRHGGLFASSIAVGRAVVHRSGQSRHAYRHFVGRRVMSIYRTIDEGPVTDFSVQPVKVKRARHQTCGAAYALSEASHKHLRRANPASDPLPATFKWIARLPRNVRPIELLRQFPRVANALATSWHEPRAFRACLYDLLGDKRGNRRGFPNEVLSELLALQSYVDNSCL